LWTHRRPIILISAFHSPELVNLKWKRRYTLEIAYLLSLLHTYSEMDRGGFYVSFIWIHGIVLYL
jgi:hypothetical protein